jgi:beta-1,4-mannosyltransferase
MKNAYIYPITAYAHKTIPNPYLENLINSLGKYFEFLNKEKPATNGIFDIIQYFRKVEYVFVNWVEDLPDKRGGVLQGLFFIVLVNLLKYRKTKIVWTLHNKFSHYKSNYYFKKFLFKFLVRKSDLIITHSREGIRYIRECYPNNYQKIKYFPHPLEKKFLQFKDNPANDILIWGSIIPYKGIDKFLQHLFDNNLENKYKIRIIGKIKPDSYIECILKLCNASIHVDNRYIPEEELKRYVADSKIVIFTYIGDSVLSSGVLMDTLSYGGNILAPSVGAFKDAEEDGLINTFETYDDLIRMIDIYLSSSSYRKNDSLKRFIEENSWSKFSDKISEWLN